MAEKIKDVEVLSRESHDSLGISRQLADLRNLKDGWADGMQPADQWGEGYGKAPMAQGLDWLAGTFAARYADDLPPPYIYPTPEGGVSLEWSIGQNEASLEIDLFRHSAEWHCLNLRTGRSMEGDFDLDDDEDWERLASKIRQLGVKDE